MYFLYSLLLGAALALTSPWWTLRMLRHGKYRAGMGERLGRVPARLVAGECSGCVWVHAVSVGEVLALGGLVQELRRRFPACRIVISTTTATGQKLARERFGAGNVFYFPLDFAFAIRPYLRAVRPELIIVAETEFWPNFLRLARASGARLAVVNARISDRSLPRYRFWRGLMRPVLSAIDVFLAQSDEDAHRLVAIGAPAARVRVSGNLKFDLAPPRELPLIASLRMALRAGPVIVAGSTVDGEEPQVLDAFRAVLNKFPAAVLLLAPRHPERFGAVAGLLAVSGLKFWRRSDWNGEPLASGVFLLDSIGELGAAYALADTAFVGGSLAPRGGHNILEPAFYGAPVLVGPHTENFRDVIALFLQADAVRVVRDANELASALLTLLSGVGERAALGQRAASVLKQHSGATARTADAVETLLATSRPATSPSPESAPR